MFANLILDQDGIPTGLTFTAIPSYVPEPSGAVFLAPALALLRRRRRCV